MRVLAFALVVTVGLLNHAVRAQTAIRYGYTAGGDSLPVFAAEEEGLFRKAGLKLELQRLSNTAVAAPALVAKSIDVAQMTTPVFLMAYEGGLELVIVCGLNVYGPELAVGAVALPNSNIKTASDFLGKRVAVAGVLGTMHILFVKWLRQHGVDPRGINFVEANFSVMPEMLKSKQVDVVLLGGPSFNRVINEGTGQMIGNIYQEVAQGQVLNMVVTTRQWAEANKEALARFRTAMVEGGESVARDDEKARAYLAKYLSLGPDVAKRMDIPRSSFPISQAQFEWWRDTLKDQNLIKGNIDLKRLTVE